nr:MAG TPA: dystroglycan [Caudoviricetes sp.]
MDAGTILEWVAAFLALTMSVMVLVLLGAILFCFIRDIRKGRY